MKFFRILLVTTSVWLGCSLSLPVIAACCKCAVQGSTDILCLTDDTATCGEIIAKNKSTNPALANVTCATPLDPASSCRIFSAGGSAQCKSEPIAANIYSASAAAGDTVRVTPLEITPPKLNIPIPNLKFSDRVLEVNHYLEIPFLAQYISAMVSFLLGITTLAAAVMIVYGGTKYIFSQTSGQVQSGKDEIQNALIGLLLVFASVMILRTVNPQTTLLKPLRVKVIEPEVAKLITKHGSTSDSGNTTAAETKLVSGKGGFEFLLSSCKERVAEGPWTRAIQACRGSTGTKADLIRVVKAFKREGVDTLTAEYVNGGVNGGTKLISAGTRSVFMYGQIKDTPFFTDDVKQACEGKKPESTDLRESDPCYKALLQRYAERVISPVVCKDLIGTDCGYLVSQMLACAKIPGFKNIFDSAYKLRDEFESRQAILDTVFGSSVAVNDKMTLWEATGNIDVTKDADLQAYKKISPTYTPAQFGKFPKGFLGVPRKVCEKYSDSCSAKKVVEGDRVNGPGLILAAEGGKMKFGAIILIRCGGRAHFLMYTGKSGDSEINYEIMETGNGTQKPYRKGGSGLSVSKTLRGWVEGDTQCTYLYENTLP